MAIKHRICFVVSSEITVTAFLANHIRALSKQYEVTVILNGINTNFLKELKIDASLVLLPISRKINLGTDLLCLCKLIWIFLNKKFLFVHSVTPKAGLLAMLASFIARVPNRVHTFTGQVWATKKGVARLLLKNIDCLISNLTTRAIVDSASQLEFLVNQDVIKPNKAVVFAHGSIAGVDLERFKPNLELRPIIRGELGIPEHCLILLFLGRLKYEKGVLDLVTAFNQLNVTDVELLLVGPDEDNLKMQMTNLGMLNSHIHFIEFTMQPENYMAGSDIFCLPSYREGFGMVLIEAAATGIPSVASNIYGISDAVVNGSTGLLHEPKNINEIKACLESLITNDSLRKDMGDHALARVKDKFDSKLLTKAWVDFYEENTKKIV